MTTRLNLLPDPRFAPLQAGLTERVAASAAAIDRDTFADVLDPLMGRVLRDGFDAAGAHEGTVWLADAAGEHLVGAYNTGPNADQVVGFRQPLREGLVSMVYASEQPFCENGVYRHERQDKTLDRSTRQLTCAMIVVPFYFARQLRGVISCVQLKPEAGAEDPPGFSVDSLRRVQLAAAVLSRLLDHRLITVSVGWEGE